MSGMAFLATLLLTLLGNNSLDPRLGNNAAKGDGSTLILCRSPELILTSEEEDESVDLGKLEQIPKIWIGVRVSTVPDALAAHLGRGTLMIVNVAEDSPADQAGLDRYDVMLSFNGREIGDMEDLLKAIQENGADQAATLVVIQRGEERNLTLTPTRRDLTIAPIFKYEEQELAEVDPLQKYFGHRLKLGPGGEFLFMPQGRLDRLPDDIKGLLEEVPDLNWDVLEDLPSRFSLDLDEDLPGFEFFLDGKEIDESAHITITITEDGESTTIERHEDGTFTVEHEHADQSRTSESYDNLDQLREKDPEAYRIYRKSAPHRGFSTIILPPDLKNLDKQQQQFQLELERQIDKAERRAEEARQQARGARARVEVHRKKSTGVDTDHATHTKTVTLVVDDEHIKLTITEDGVTRKYEFDSREDFEKSEPELYESYRSYLDG